MHVYTTVSDWKKGGGQLIFVTNTYYTTRHLQNNAIHVHRQIIITIITHTCTHTHTPWMPIIEEFMTCSTNWGHYQTAHRYYHQQPQHHSLFRVPKYFLIGLTTHYSQQEQGACPYNNITTTWQCSRHSPCSLTIHNYTTCIANSIWEDC